MGLLSSLAPVLGSVAGSFAGPLGAGIGGAIGSAVGGSMDAADANALQWQQIGNQQQYNAQQAAITREFNSAEAGRQREWAEEMSSTAWQRGIADMRRAGINPMLAASQGGASTPSGASASSVPGSSASSIHPVLRSVISSEVAANSARAAHSYAEADKAEAEAAKERAGVPFAREHEEIKITMKRTEQFLQNYQANIAEAANAKRVPYALAEAAIERVNQIRAEIRRAKSQEDLNRAHERLIREVDLPKGLAYADYYRTVFGKGEPYWKEYGKPIASAAGAAVGLSAGARLIRRGGVGLRFNPDLGLGRDLRSRIRPLGE